jgi:hypothetical protein
MSETPTVTIALPTRNRRPLLLRALNSALGQTYPRVEVLVSDNASSDDTAEALADIRDPRLRVLRQRELIPMMRHWDVLVQEARGEYFLMLSDDDFLEPEALANLVARIEDGVGMSYGLTAMVDGDGRRVRMGRRAPASEPPTQTILEFFSARRTPFACSILLRTADVRAAGGYAGVPLALLGDARVWIAASLPYPRVAFVDEHLSNYSVHAESATTAARATEWMRENTALAAWCADRFTERDDPVSAAEVRRRAANLGARSAALLIAAQVRSGRGRAEAIRQMLGMDVFRSGFYPRAMLMWGLALIAAPRAAFSAVEALRRKLRGWTDAPPSSVSDQAPPAGEAAIGDRPA